MSLITYTELCKLVYEDEVLCTSKLNAKPYDEIPIDNINGASIDVRLGQIILREKQPQCPWFTRLKNKDELIFTKESYVWGQEFYLEPGEFILAHTVEIFNLPDYIGGEFRLKSSGARAALDQALAVWCDPGWHESVLTLELKNNSRYHTLVLEVGMKIGQVVLFKGESVPKHASYAVRGQYNNDKEATGNKGVK